MKTLSNLMVVKLACLTLCVVCVVVLAPVAVYHRDVAGFCKAAKNSLSFCLSRLAE